MTMIGYAEKTFGRGTIFLARHRTLGHQSEINLHSATCSMYVLSLVLRPTSTGTVEAEEIQKETVDRKDIRLIDIAVV